MLLAALQVWPARGVPGTGWLERLGIASYEVFLVQVVWLGVLTDRGQVPFLVAALASGLLGWAMHRVLTGTAVGSLGRRRARSPAVRPLGTPTIVPVRQISSRDAAPASEARADDARRRRLPSRIG